MKRLLALLVVIVLLGTSTPVLASGLASSPGVDLFRGAWGGTLTARPLPGQSVDVQLNLYFNESVPSDDPASFKAWGYSSITWEEPEKPKRAKATLLPMMAKYTETDEGIFDITILATFPTPPWASAPGKAIYKLEGIAKMSGSGVPDDIIEGKWYLKKPDGNIVSGQWSVVHLDRRSVQAPEVSLDDPTLYFRGDAFAILRGPANPDLSTRNPNTRLESRSNIVMDGVQVTLPNGTTKILPPFTDPFSPGVDWVTEFRFTLIYAGLPMAGGIYKFTALDIGGNPIPGVQATDAWIGPPTVQPPDPPTNTAASWVTAPKPGIQVSWNAVPDIPESFDPPQIGFYQIAVLNSGNAMVYGANNVGGLSHIIPQNMEDFILGEDWGISINELAPGTYRLQIMTMSLAPAGSGGRGFEYESLDPRQSWLFDILQDGSVSNLRKST